MSIEQSLRELSQVSSHQFPDSSAKWLLRQREHLEALLEMLLGSVVEAFDFSGVEQLNRSFIFDELRPQESDMIFKVPFRQPMQTPQEVIVYLLIEHQSRVDRSMGLRVLSYMVQIWMEERRQWEEEKRPQSEWRVTPIIPIVFYTGSGEWKVPVSLTALMDIPEVLTRFVPTFDTLLLDVKATDPDALTQTGHPLGWVLTVLRQEHANDPAAMRQALLEALEGLRDFHTHDAEQYQRAILYIFLLILHRRPEAERQDLFSILTQEYTQNMEIVDMAESIIEISEQRGLQQGKREGRREGRREGIEQGRREGIEQGERRASIENIMMILTERFPEADVNALDPTLNAIEDLNRLKELNRNALTARSFHAFRDRLEA